MSRPGFRERAEQALSDSFLRRAVRFATDRFRAARDRGLGELSDVDRMRDWARRVRAHTIAHLDHYLAQLAERVRANGGHVFFAADASEAVRYVADLARQRAIKLAVKSKSMLSEELSLNEALESVGVEVVESDLGEYIVQRAGQKPSHIIAPALHMNREQIVGVLSCVAGRPLSSDTASLTAFARGVLREVFLSADMGITGCNFAVAETGSLVIVTNEGNGRMVTTLPRIQVTLMGMERVLPTLDDLDLLLTLLTRSATGQRASVYTTVMTGPRRQMEGDGPDELHLVVVDNMRSSLLGTQYQDALHCIRCGACSNVCPVYRQVGGHAYGWVYGGPIGAVLTPLFRGLNDWGELAEASSLCGACWEVCPVQIPLHEMLIGIRRDLAQVTPRPLGERLGFRLWAWAFSRPAVYRAIARLARWALRPLARQRPGGDLVLSRGPGPLGAWTKGRDLPLPAARSFRDRWAELVSEPAPEFGERPSA